MRALLRFIDWLDWLRRGRPDSDAPHVDASLVALSEPYVRLARGPFTRTERAVDELLFVAEALRAAVEVAEIPSHTRSAIEVAERHLHEAFQALEGR